MQIAWACAPLWPLSLRKMNIILYPHALNFPPWKTHSYIHLANSHLLSTHKTLPVLNPPLLFDSLNYKGYPTKCYWEFKRQTHKASSKEISNRSQRNDFSLKDEWNFRLIELGDERKGIPNQTDRESKCVEVRWFRVGWVYTVQAKYRIQGRSRWCNF